MRLPAFRYLNGTWITQRATHTRYVTTGHSRHFVALITTFHDVSAYFFTFSSLILPVKEMCIIWESAKTGKKRSSYTDCITQSGKRSQNLQTRECLHSCMVTDNAVYSAVLSSTSTALLHSVERTTSIATSRSTTPYSLRFLLPNPALFHSVERTTSIATTRSITPYALQFLVPSPALFHSVERTTSIATSRSITPYTLQCSVPSPALFHSVERTTSIATSRSITPSALQYSVPRLKKTLCIINYNVYRFFGTEDQCGLGLGSTLVSSPLNQDIKNVTQAYLGYIYALRSNRTHNPRVKRQKVFHVLDCAVVVIGLLKQRILPLSMSPHPIRDYHITRE